MNRADRPRHTVRTAVAAPAFAVALVASLAAGAPAAAGATHASGGLSTTGLTTSDLTFVPVPAADATALTGRTASVSRSFSRLGPVTPMKVEKSVVIKEEISWMLPIAGYRLTGRFGSYGGLWSSSHTGLDFAAPLGTPVASVAAGVVSSASYDGSYGNKVVVTLDEGGEAWFCHLGDFAVSVGQRVSAGALLGHVGMTGNTTGPHLHLELRDAAGNPQDPEAVLVAHGLRP